MDNDDTGRVDVNVLQHLHRLFSWYDAGIILLHLEQRRQLSKYKECTFGP